MANIRSEGGNLDHGLGPSRKSQRRLLQCGEMKSLRQGSNIASASSAVSLRCNIGPQSRLTSRSHFDSLKSNLTFCNKDLDR